MKEQSIPPKLSVGSKATKEKEDTKCNVKRDVSGGNKQSDSIINDDDFASRYVIHIESSSRLTRSATRRTQMNSELGREDVRTVDKGKRVYVEIDDTKSEDKEKKKRQRDGTSGGSKKKRPTFANLRTRTSPKTLHETIVGLNAKQQEAVRSIGLGLGPLLDMGLDGVPSKLGFFVVGRLNTRSMLLELPSGSISITVETVNQLLGLPMGGIDLAECDDDFYELMLTKD